MLARRTTALFAALFAIALTRSAAGSEPLPIYGGAKVAPCAWPTTVALGGCTGTLVHPELVVFAAHCMEGGYGPSSATFGDNENSPAFEVPTTQCGSDPQYYGGSGHDVAYCRLAQPVTSVPIVPILMGCETQAISPGADVVAVGFGQANDGLGWGPKRQVAMKVNSLQGGEVFIGGNGKDTCYGDSGGPVYIRASDGTWRVFGITSYGEYCGGGGYYSMMHTAIGWLEQSSGLDLTPCHEDGSWAPTSACAGFPLDPDLGGGTWSNGCATGQLSGPSATCGTAFDGTTTSSGGSTGSGGAPPTGGSGGAPPVETGGSGGEPPTPPPPAGACSGAPNCGGCEGCVESCVCQTGDSIGCQQACAPYEPGTQPPANANPVTPAPRTDSSDVQGGCGCRLAPSTRGAWLAALIAAVCLSMRRRSQGACS